MVVSANGLSYFIYVFFVLSVFVRGKIGYFACFGVARECVASKCASAGATTLSRGILHLIIIVYFNQYGRMTLFIV